MHKQCLIQGGHLAPDSSPWTVERSIQPLSRAFHPMLTGLETLILWQVTPMDMGLQVQCLLLRGMGLYWQDSTGHGLASCKHCAVTRWAGSWHWRPGRASPESSLHPHISPVTEAAMSSPPHACEYPWSLTSDAHPLHRVRQHKAVPKDRHAEQGVLVPVPCFAWGRWAAGCHSAHMGCQSCGRVWGEGLGRSGLR